MKDIILAEKKIRIRPMGLEDIGQVHEIDVMCFSMPWTERSYRFELTENQTSCSWVAEVIPDDPGLSSKIAGMVVTWSIIDEIHIATIAVHPDYRQLGIGRHLLGCALINGAYHGANLALLEVRKSNLSAQALYKQFGFTEVGIRPKYYQDNMEDALLMNLEPIEISAIRQLVEP